MITVTSSYLAGRTCPSTGSSAYARTLPSTPLTKYTSSAEGAHPLTIWTPAGGFVSSWGEGAFSNNEHGIFITPDDNVWLVDSNFHIATEHKPDGTLVRTLGTKLNPQPTYYGGPV